MNIHPKVRKFLSDMGKKGGKATSDAKKFAVRDNGKKGGRPIGQKNAPKKPIK